MRVVVIDVVDDEPLELVAVPDDGAVEELASKGADPAFGERVRHGVRTGVLRTLQPSVLKISSKASMNWLARSRTSARASASWWPCWSNRFRAAWLAHTPVGWFVIPAKYTVQVEMSMKNSR